jgi:hypothetical protein
MGDIGGLPESRFHAWLKRNIRWPTRREWNYLQPGQPDYPAPPPPTLCNIVLATLIAIFVILAACLFVYVTVFTTLFPRWPA